MNTNPKPTPARSPSADAPQQLREMAETGAKQSKETLEKMSAATTDTAEMMTNCASTALKELQEYNSKLAEFTPDELMQSGNGELVNWAITAGMCGDVKARVLDYVRLWHIGLGYLYWEV